LSSAPYPYGDEPEDEEPEPDRDDDSQWFAGHGFWYWHLMAENGEIISDSAEGYHHKGYAVTMAEKLNPNAELVIDES
jgi:uncharacterized protein YegP (UPF0339 family)